MDNQLTEKKLTTKSNTLINARYELSATEQKFIALCATKIKKDDKVFQDITIHSDELYEIHPIKNPWEELKRISDSIFDKEIFTRSEDGEGYTRRRWVSKADYKAGKGKVSFRFSEDVHAFLLLLNGRFTQYDIKVLDNFKNKYTQRIYELLLQHKFKAGKVKVVIYSIDELRDMLMIDDKYKDWYEFRRNVIENAMKEMKNTELKNLTYETIKEGRRVVKLRFSYEIDRSLAENFKKDRNEASRDDGLKIKSIVDFKGLVVSNHQAVMILMNARGKLRIKSIEVTDISEREITYIEEKVDKTIERQNDESQEELFSPAAYLLDTVTNDY